MSGRCSVRASRLLAGAVLGLIVAGVLGALLLSPVALAHRQTGALEYLYGNFAVWIVARANGPASMPSPPAPGQTTTTIRSQNSAKLLANAGRNAYTGSCAQCHGDKGDGKGTLGANTTPAATDLTAYDTRQKTDGQLFWIIKNGLGFTGMPAFAKDFPDEDIAALVTYIRALQKGQGTPPEIAPPTAEQLQMANPQGEPAQRGAAVYFAQNCQRCHGAVGQAPEELTLGDLADLDDSVRHGRPGMPMYGPEKISDAQMKDLLEYLKTFPSPQEE